MGWNRIASTRTSNPIDEVQKPIPSSDFPAPKIGIRESACKSTLESETEGTWIKDWTCQRMYRGELSSWKKSLHQSFIRLVEEFSSRLKGIFFSAKALSMDLHGEWLHVHTSLFWTSWWSEEPRRFSDNFISQVQVWTTPWEKRIRPPRPPCELTSFCPRSMVGGWSLNVYVVRVSRLSRNKHRGPLFTIALVFTTDP